MGRRYGVVRYRISRFKISRGWHLCHWLVDGHMTSNNETVSRQMPRAGNIPKTMTSIVRLFKVIHQKKKFPMNFLETFPECSPPSIVSKKTIKMIGQEI